VGFGFGDWWVASRLESVADSEVRVLVAAIGRLMPSKPGGFGVSGKVFLAEGLGGLSTFRDLLSSGMFFAGEAEGIS
jgi:hypothetical protein